MSSSRSSELSVHGRANQQLVISDAVPPPWPGYSHISCQLGLCWLTSSGSPFSKNQMKQTWPVITWSARSPPSLPSPGVLIMRETEPGFQNKGAVCFLLGFLLQACSSVCVRVPPFDVEHANVCLRHPTCWAAGAMDKNLTGRCEDRGGKERGKVFFPFQSTLYSWLF